MALTNTCLRFLLWAKSQGVATDKILTLGHLENETTGSFIDHLDKKYSAYIDTAKIKREDKFADSIFSALGADEIQSLDYSGFENASLLYDLNEPLPANLHNQFSLVIDGGSLEHIFNFPQAIKNCMQATRMNGHFIGFSPANNLMGHGFYQFSPELFFRIFSEQNGFKVVNMFLIAAPFQTDTDTWYQVMDPAEINDRVLLSCKNPVYLMVLAKKINEIVPWVKMPQQSDYVKAWRNENSDGKENKQSPGFMTSSYRRMIPNEKRNKVRVIYERIFRKVNHPENLEKINNSFFKKFKF